MHKMMRWMVLWISMAHAIEIPIEEGLEIISLPNGVQICLRPDANSPNIVACRVVAYDRSEGMPQIFSLSCSTPLFEEELPHFISCCKEEIKQLSRCDIGVVAVGDFHASGLQEYLSNSWERISAHTDVTSIPHGKRIETDRDVKELWMLQLLQSIDGERGGREEGRTVPPAEGSYLLPLRTALEGMRQVKEEELFNAKAKVQRELMTLYQPHPNADILADYYAAHFILGSGYPCYDLFMRQSMQALSTISMQDITECLTTYHQANRVVVIPSDPLQELPLTETDRRLIYEIIDTIAANNPVMLGLKRSELKKKGRKIHHVHPVKFLETVFTNPHLKTCMGEIRESYFKWHGFINGIAERLTEEYNRGNLLIYVPGLCRALHANPDHVTKLVQKQAWESLVKYLIKL